MFWEDRWTVRPTRRRGDCGRCARRHGCVATASTGGQFPAKELVFDDVGGRWLAVIASQSKCDNVDGELFNVISLQPRSDGTMNGEWATANSKGCFHKRTATFTRTADTDIGTLADPATQPSRVVSPAEALHGRYNREVSYPDGDGYQESDYRGRTDCLRTGDRCVSVFANPDAYLEILVFENGRWTSNSEFDTPCEVGGASHVKISAEYPLPQSPQDPITLLTGHGHEEATGSACASGDFDEKFVRTGD